MKPTLIGKSEKPRALKDADMKRVPVHYRAQKSSWMTSQLFTDFLQWFDTEAEKKEQNRKIQLFMDIGNVHNSAADNVLLKHTKVVFFPKTQRAVLNRSMLGCFSKCGFMRNEGPVVNIGMPEVTLEELELQGMEAADAGIVFAPTKTITQVVKEALATVGKVREEDPQKTDCEDEEPTPVSSSAAARKPSKRSCCTLRVEVMWES
ncbi:Tigger transposable element-derived protein 4-like [Oopsacas minuta]|uniref:Tigger transposable element-derived protein 4-like n=1 Tax=Oopsacas minuta TaxID=111878 RepID=A0AAV7JJG8_9METZ|nr:Tigger transposable element-derived protein 4-like [Oopsacas minuta]